MFENYGAMTMLSAQLRSQRVKMPDGSMKSMWDLYDNKGEYTGPVRGVEIDSVGNEVEISELTALEVGRLKRVYEKAHGSYRQEERVALELNVFGQWLLQFKRYLPMLWRTNWGLNREEVFLGSYKLKLDENGMPVKANGMDVYTWEKTQTGGRIWLALRLIGGYFGDKNSPYYDKSKSWENFTNAEKQDLLAGLSNVFIVALALLIFNLGVPPEEKDKVWARRTRRLIEDISLGLNPADLVRPMVKPLPQLEKLLELWDAMGDFMWRGGISGQTDSRGWPKGTYRI